MNISNYMTCKQHLGNSVQEQIIISYFKERNSWGLFLLIFKRLHTFEVDANNENSRDA